MLDKHTLGDSPMKRICGGLHLKGHQAGHGEAAVGGVAAVLLREGLRRLEVSASISQSE